MVSTGVQRLMDCSGIGAHRNESQTLDAAQATSKQKNNILAFRPSFVAPMQMAA